MIAGPDGVCGFTTKSEGEAAAFKRGRFKSTISTPFGTVGVGICYDSRRKLFYDNVKNEKLSLILFPHGAPADPKKPNKERQENEQRCMKYVEAFGVPVVYVNSIGKLEYMPGMMGRLMKMSRFRMNGMSKIYANDLREISSDMPEVVAAEVEVSPKQRAKDIRFYGNDILNSNWIFRKMILEPDTRMGIRRYEEGVGRRKKDIIALILVMIPAAFLIVAWGIRIGLSINRDHFLAGDDLYAGLMQTSFALFGLSVFPGILLSILGIVSGKISGASQYKVIGGLEVIVEILVICSFFYAGAHF